MFFKENMKRWLIIHKKLHAEVFLKEILQNYTQGKSTYLLPKYHELVSGNEKMMIIGQLLVRDL